MGSIIITLIAFKDLGQWQPSLYPTGHHFIQNLSGRQIKSLIMPVLESVKEFITALLFRLSSKVLQPGSPEDCAICTIEAALSK